MAEGEKKEIIIDDEVSEETPEISIEGLSEEEIKSGREQGIIPEEKKEEGGKKEAEDEHKEQPDAEAKKDKDGKKQEEKDEKVKDAEGKEAESKKKEPEFQSFEDTEKDENNLVNNYSSNEKALYFKWKHDKQARQQAQKEAGEYKSQFEHNKVQSKAYQQKLEQINTLLGGDPASITVEAIQGILAGKEEKSADKPLTRKDLEDIEAGKKAKAEEQKKAQELINSRIKAGEELGKSRYEDFDAIVDLAQEVIKSDTSNTYSTLLAHDVANPDVDIDKVVERVVSIARLNEKFGKKSEKDTPKDTNKDLNRMVENAKKKPSSASVGGGHGKRVIDEADLTIEDAAKLSPDQWGKLSSKTRERLLEESSK